MIETIAVMDTPTVNGRVYPREVMEKAVEEFRKKLPAPAMFGGDGLNVDLEKASHMVTDLEIDGNKVLGKIKVLNTPYGNILKQLIESGTEVRYFTAGHGNIDYTKTPPEVKDFVLTHVSVGASI